MAARPHASALTGRLDRNAREQKLSTFTPLCFPAIHPRPFGATGSAQIVLEELTLEEFAIHETTIGERRAPKDGLCELAVDEDTAVKQAPVPLEPVKLASDKGSVNVTTFDRVSGELAIAKDVVVVEDLRCRCRVSVRGVFYEHCGLTLSSPGAGSFGDPV